MFVLGTQYYRFPTPIEADWPADLARIRRHGMTTVKCWLNWAHVQPTREEFTFDLFDRMMDACHQVGLQVVIQAHMYPPRWWRQGHTVAARIVEETPGDTTLCLDNPDYFAGAQRFLETMIRHYHQHPALFAWDCWNEPGPTMCQCTHTMAEYRTWLLARYGDLRLLTARYGTADVQEWADIKHVELKELPQSLDFYRFHRQHIATLFARLGTIYHAGDPTHPVMTHDVFNGVSGAYSDRQQMTPLDLHGVSLHIPQVDGDHPRFATERYLLPFSLAIKDRCAQTQGKALWVSELFGGAQVFTVPSASPPRVDTLRLALWESVAHGITGLLFWQYRPERFTFQ